MSVFSVGMGGEAGYGINSTGLSLSKIAVRSGYNIFNYFEYPSVVRGGHTLFRSEIYKDKISGVYSNFD